MDNKFEQYDDRFLKAYCHYPIELAEKEFQQGQKELYRILALEMWKE